MDGPSVDLVLCNLHLASPHRKLPPVPGQHSNYNTIDRLKNGRLKDLFCFHVSILRGFNWSFKADHCLVDLLDILYRISGEMASHIALEILKSAINSCVTVERVKMSRLKVGVLEKERV